MKLIIPEKTFRINENQFEYNEDIEEVVFPASLMSIGICAFKNCTNLRKITFHGDNMPEINSSSFSNCNIDKITFDVKNISINSLAFAAKNFHFTKNVKRIDVNSFVCNEFTIDKENTAFSVKDGVLYNKNMTMLIKYPRRATYEEIACDFVVPETCKIIYTNAFTGCKIKNLKLENVEFIKENAFRNCLIEKIESFEKIEIETEGFKYSTIKNIALFNPETKLNVYFLDSGPFSAKEDTTLLVTKEICEKNKETIEMLLKDEAFVLKKTELYDYLLENVENGASFLEINKMVNSVSR